MARCINEMRKKMKRGLLLFLITAIALVFCSCSGGNEKDIGHYDCVGLELDGESFEVGDVYPTGCTLELMDYGQAWLTVNTERFYARWRAESGGFTLDLGGALSYGTVSDGVCTVNLGESGMKHVFLREGAKLPEKTPEEKAEDTLTDYQLFWNGDWYGFWSINNAQGLWLDQNAQSFDCFARIDISADGSGTMLFWDELQSASEPAAEIMLSISESDGANGIAVCDGGVFFNTELDKGQWSMDVDAWRYDSCFVIENAHYESEEGSFDYSIILRPWGRTWEDIEAAEPQLMPYFYYDWYLPLLSSGGSIRDEFAAPAVDITRDVWIDEEEEAQQ